MNDSPNSFPSIPETQRGHLKPFLWAVVFCAASMGAAYVLLTSMT